MFGCLFGHEFMSVKQFDNGSMCPECFDTEYGCPHFFKVCIRCGKAEGYGSHGKLSIIPITCKAQIASMRLGTNYKGEPGEI